jgi:hypothetical protein
MLFYFLTDYAGQDFIRDMLENIAKKGSSHVRPYLNNKIKNARDTYSTFALYNWNRPPVKKYNDHGPIKGFPTGKASKNQLMKVDEEEKETVKLKPGAIKYYSYVFDQKDTKLKHVAVSFDNTLTSDEYVKRQAIVRIDGQWKQPEDWSGETYKEYCRRRELKNEKIEALVLVYSNADFSDKGEKTVDSFRIRTEGCPKEMDISITAKTYLKTPDVILTTKSEFTETLEIKDHYLYLVKNVYYSYNTEATIEGKKALESSGSFSTSVEEPELANSFSRILKNTKENIPGAAEAYAKFGISDNIPDEGVLITIPALMESTDLSGSTKVYLPPPVGTMTLPAMPFDGLTTIGGVYPKEDDWKTYGIRISRKIDILNHNNPLTSMFTLDDYGAFMEQLENIPDMEGYSMPESEEMNEAMEMLEGLDMEGLPDLGDFGFGGSQESGDSSGTGFGLNDLTEIIGVMNNTGKCPPGTTFYVEFEVNGMYTKFYE